MPKRRSIQPIPLHAGFEAGNESETPSAARRHDASVLLEGAGARPMFVRPACRTAFPLPQSVGAFAESLALRLMPEIVGAAIRPPRLLPEQIGVLANDLVQTGFGLGQNAVRIAKGGQLAAPADVH